MRTLRLHRIIALGLLIMACAIAKAQTPGAYKYQWEGTTPEDAISATDEDKKTVFLVNVGEYLNASSKNAPFYIGRGQAWGTEIVISNIPIPLSVESGSTGGTYCLKTKVIEQGKSTEGYIGFINDNNNRRAYFDDRGTGDNINATFTKATVEGLSSSKVYTIAYTYDGDSYYTAALYNPSGSDNVDRTDHVNGFTAAQWDTEKSKHNQKDENHKWMLITLKELKDYFLHVDAAQNDPAISTFLLDDPDFGRKDVNISSWVDGNNKPLVNDLGRDQNTGEFMPNDSWTYYVGNGFYRDDGGDDDGNGQLNNGGQWTANIKGQGKVSQTITMDGLREGWYAIRVSATVFGVSTEDNTERSKVKLFAETTNKSGETFYQPSSATAYIPGVKETPEHFIDAEKIINDGYHQVSVLVYVGGGDGNNNLIIPKGNKSTYTQRLTVGIDATGADAGAWTCFDNFQLWYLGKPQNKVLLDEDNTDISQINKQNTYVNTYNLTNGSRSKSTVFMKRKMTANQWSTLVLPFSIEEDVVSSVFGAGTVYAELKGANDKDNPTTIYFVRRTDGIKAGKLYLIRPAKSQPTDQGYVSSSTTEDGKETGSPLIEFGKNGDTDGQSYWVFEAVDFGNNRENGVDKDYTGDVYNDEDQGKESYHEEGYVYFKGTYVNHGGELYIPAYSYVLSGSNTSSGKAKAGKWYYRTKGTKTKGFRGWLQTVCPTTQSQSARTTFFVDGEEWETEGGTVTDIDGITIDGKKVIIIGDGVYNLQGQRVRESSSLDGIAKGVYIVNGKKVLVK